MPATSAGQVQTRPLPQTAYVNPVVIVMATHFSHVRQERIIHITGRPPSQLVLHVPLVSDMFCTLKLIVFSLGDEAGSFDEWYLGHFLWDFPGEGQYRTLVMKTRYWLLWWLCAIRQQALTLMLLTPRQKLISENIFKIVLLIPILGSFLIFMPSFQVISARDRGSLNMRTALVQRDTFVSLPALYQHRFHVPVSNDTKYSAVPL